MKIIAVNGSPRKRWNTATMLKSALKGAASRGANTELIHLFDLDFKGCHSCFACKLKNPKTPGKCKVRDDLKPVFEKIHKCDGLILGSPIYFGEVTGEMRSFLERLFFPILVYSKERKTLFPRRIPTAFIYTMNIPETMVKDFKLERVFEFYENLLEMLIGPCQSLMSYDTLQFDDYSKYVADRFDAEQKLKRHKEIFPLDCQKAFELGQNMVS